ncbi:hypothetical protein JAAARDRAFT_191067 [Jaapia argillacea MUCL 33604]|uniref:SAP domain-containing protein n=1 Tax=Jaapia argillacea MUCL 33604 TaxID=933084 RepID=A0A067QBT3_9AGAM|nr:hypothetical protein JAAARDRAFT_191067 [Jaapia argillacea MUCL 33604]
MLRVSSHARSLRPLATRSFVSSVLLSRSWESETTNSLKQELKKRGLSVTGTKATLITRIRQFDSQNSIQPPTSTSPQPQARNSSTVVTPEGAVSPIVNQETILDPIPEPEATVPGIPSSAEPAKPIPKQYLDVFLPDVSAPDQESPIQIPYVPDFWSSSLSKVPHDSSPPSPPKLLIVGGSETHHGGGPSYQLHDDLSIPLPSSSPSSGSSSNSTSSGIITDVLEDLHIPTPSQIRTGLANQKDLLDTITASLTASSTEKRSYERELDREEKRGVLVLLGLLVGGWGLGGLLGPAKEGDAHGEGH